MRQPHGPAQIRGRTVTLTLTLTPNPNPEANPVSVDFLEPFHGVTDFDIRLRRLVHLRLVDSLVNWLICQSVVWLAWSESGVAEPVGG